MKGITAVVGVFGLTGVLSASAQPVATIPIRAVTPAVSTDSGVIMNIFGLRALPGNRVMVHDYTRKRIIIFDESLKRFTTVMDTAAGAPANYGTTISPGLIPYLGDSTLIIDRSSTAFLIVDPSGKLGGILSPPKASDLPYMSSGLMDAKGRIVFRGFRRPPPSRAPAPPPAAPAAPGVPQIGAAGPDSAPILRGDFDARTVDTVGMFHIAPTKSVSVRMPPNASGGISMIGTGMFNPLPLTDEWTLLPDGTIVIVRAQDYHIDWVLPDGKIESTPKMTFDWKRITLEDKQRIIDSVKKAYDDQPDSLKRNASFSDGVKFAMPFVVVEPAELPDYYPPVRAGQVKADYDGNVWILPSTSSLSNGGLLFDVVNRKGEVFERVQLPPNRNLLGFGPGGMLYLSPPSGPAGSGTRLERVQVIRPGAPIKQ